MDSPTNQRESSGYRWSPIQAIRSRFTLPHEEMITANASQREDDSPIGSPLRSRQTAPPSSKGEALSFLPPQTEIV